MSMTSLEARAHCIAKVLNSEPDSWGKAQAESAAVEAKKLLESGQIDTATFADVALAVSGNHSAMRQKLVSYGLLATKETDSAEKRQIAAAMKSLADAEEQSLAEMTAGKKK